MAKRASEDLFDELHSLLTTELIGRIKSGEATTADLRAAIDWLKANDITGVAVSGSPLASSWPAFPILPLMRLTVSAGNSRTNKYYKKNPKAAAKRKAYDRKYSKKNYGSEAPDSAKKRKRNKTAAERAKWRRKNGMVNTRKGKGKDASHTKSGVWSPNPRVGTVPGTVNQAAPQRSKPPSLMSQWTAPEASCTICSPSALLMRSVCGGNRSWLGTDIPAPTAGRQRI